VVDDSNVVFGQTFHSEKGSVRLCIVVMNSTSTQLCEMLYTADSQDMLLLSSTVPSRYYNWCTDDSTSPGNRLVNYLHADITWFSFKALSGNWKCS
jgi:hypothetical protein